VDIVTLDDSEIMPAAPEPPRKFQGQEEEKTEESGAAGRRGPIGHSAEESRPYTDNKVLAG
jgi:hypothetical protein